MPLVVKNGELVTVSGSLATDVACCCGDPTECPCIFPTDWRITDGDGNVYAQGKIFAAGGPACETTVTALADLPNPFTPLFYWQAGELSLKLEVLGCNGANWDTLDSWSATISLCDGGRYPSQPLDGPWQPPGPCACKNQQNVDDGIEECDPCPDLTAGSGDGQAWRDPQPGTGEVFTGAIDGEWTNLLNWEDVNGLTPAGSLPGSDTNVSIEADVTSTASAITVAELTIAAGAEFSVAASAADLHCYGAIERKALCEGVFGQMTVSGEAFVYGGGVNNGEILNALVKFSGDGLNGANGVVTGDARFDDESVNGNIVTGDAEFYDESVNSSTVHGDGTFSDSTVNEGNIDGDATFNDTSSNTSSGDVVFGLATFNGNSTNDGVVRTAAFNGDSVNNGRTRDATFSASSVNAGEVDGDALFSADSVNRGTVNFTATFTDNACNDGGTAGTFIPDPPPSC